MQLSPPQGAWILIAEDGASTLDAIAIYFFLSTIVAAWLMPHAAAGELGSRLQHTTKRRLRRSPFTTFSVHFSTDTYSYCTTRKRGFFFSSDSLTFLCFDHSHVP